MAAQGIVAGIRQGCEFLREGKAQIGEIKKAIGEAQAFVNEARTLWTTIKAFWGNLVGVAPKSGQKPISSVPTREVEETPAKKETKKSAKSAEPELSYEEYQARAIHDICEKLKQFFEIKRQLSEHCHRLEEESKTTQNIEAAALDRIQIEMQMEAMTVQIREAMIYTPKDIGLQSIYSRFLKMYDQILEERAFDRELKAKQARDQAWRREYKIRLLKAKAGYSIVLVIAALWMMGLFSLL